MAALGRPIMSWLNGEDYSSLSKLQFSSEQGKMSAIVADTESLVAKVAIANNFIKGI